MFYIITQQYSTKDYIDNKKQIPRIFLCRNLCIKKNNKDNDKMAVIALAISRSPRSALISCPDPSFPSVSSRHMNSQHELPTRKDLQS